VSDSQTTITNCTCWICETTVPIASIQRHLHGHSEEEHTRAVRKMQREQVAIAASRKPDPEPVQGSFAEKKYSDPSEGVDTAG
jgi:hypothetical protein